MNIIERYIAAYVFHCLFPDKTASENHLGYVYEVLRETGSNPKNELLKNVIDFVRQGDPESEYTQSTVRKYIVAMIQETFVCRFANNGDATAYIVTKDDAPVAFTACVAGARKETEDRIRGLFPGVVFQEVSRDI